MQRPLRALAQAPLAPLPLPLARALAPLTHAPAAPSPARAYRTRMPHPRTLVAAMAAALVALAFALERAPLATGGAVAAVAHFELTHLVAHTLIYGALAALLAAWWFPPRALDGEPRSLRRRAIVAALCFLGAASAQELTQVLARGRLPGSEEVFDLAVDVNGAALGLIAWSRADRRRGYPVARALGWVLHPGVVGPIGVFAVSWASLRDPRAALGWTALATLAALPVAAVWALGLRRGWFRDVDLSSREERPRFLAAALPASVGLALVTDALPAPVALRALCLAGAIGTGLITAATLRGHKLSGHVAVPVAVLAMLCADSPRGVWPFALAALALSWARVRQGVHTPREVLGAWGVAGVSAAVARIPLL